MNPNRFALLIFLALLWLLLGSPGVAHADDGSAPSAPLRTGVLSGTLTVCPDGPPACDYDIIQDAVDAAAPGDVVKVATGVYTGTQGRSSPSGYNGPSVITQVVYISKTVTVRGGYTTTDWLKPDPVAYPTTLDARGQGRVLFIGGPSISSTVEGLQITGGDAAGLAGHPWEIDAGGGMYVLSATFTVSNTQVYSNIALAAGGAHLQNSDGTFIHSSLSDNAAEHWEGGGMFVWQSTLALEENVIDANSAYQGGGLCIRESRVTFEENTISTNLSWFGSGGGVYLDNSDIVLDNNKIISNTAGWAGDGGGGLYAYQSQLTLNTNIITSNISNCSEDDCGGGGLCLLSSDSTLAGNTISANTAMNDGGGLYLESGTTILTANTIENNVAAVGNTRQGGGAFLNSVNATLDANTIISNIAEAGAGLFIVKGDVTLNANTIKDNDARGYGPGGGLFLSFCDATLDSNLILSNTAWVAGGLEVHFSDATLVNNVIADNQAFLGSGLFIDYSSPQLLHNTIAHNTGGDGSGIYVSTYGVSTARFTNTILVSHAVGISATAGNTVTLDGTLWGNEADWGGPGTIITGTHNYWGDPAFLDPTAGDYHISPDSIARDQGITTTVATDIDGDPRPYGPGYDIGADEIAPSLAVVKHATPNPVWAGSPLTYTLRLTNTGGFPLQATVTDTLPAHILPGQTPGGTLVQPGGPITWASIDLAPGDVWIETLSVTVEPNYVGPLTNTVQVSSSRGVTGTYVQVAESVLVPDFSLGKRAYLPVVLSGDPLTYSLRLTNTGNVTLTATITDLLPEPVFPGGEIVWSDVSLGPDQVWTQGIVVTVEPSYSGTLANVMQVATEQGGRGVYTETSQVLLSPPGAPRLLAPPDGALIASTVVTLDWEAGSAYPVEGYNLALDGAVVTITETAWEVVLPLGVHTWSARAFNQAGYSGWAGPWSFEITDTLPCVPVSGVALSLLRPGTLYLGDAAQFSADLAPDGLTPPYTYTLHLDGMTLVTPQAGETDPLVFSHTFPASGTYIVGIAVWNCSLGQAGRVTDTVTVEVVERGGYRVYLPLVIKND